VSNIIDCMFIEYNKTLIYWEDRHLRQREQRLQRVGLSITLVELARELGELLALLALPGLGAFLRDAAHGREDVLEGVVHALCGAFVFLIFQTRDGRVEEHAARACALG